MSSLIPIPRCPVSVRPATAADLPFIDRLQRVHTHMVGWMPAKQLEGKVALGQVVIAEARDEETQRRRDEVEGAAAHCVSSSLRDAVSSPLGYCISADSYNGRDDVGIVYQLNVLPLKQRNLIGATLIRAVFERAAFGCRLFCCWCAQDIQANWFWESVGFVPLAFRTGSREKQRVHVFWQRRIREGDTTTPYWFPAQTKSGAVREDRIVLPIPPGTHWRDAKPIVLPGMIEDAPAAARPKVLPGGAAVSSRPEQPKASVAHRAAVVRSRSKHLQGTPPGKAAVITAGGMRYLDRGDYVEPAPPPKPKREPKPRAKNDPKLLAAARELRDRYLDEVNAGRLLPGGAAGKYDVSRALPAPAGRGGDAAAGDAVLITPIAGALPDPARVAA